MSRSADDSPPVPRARRRARPAATARDRFLGHYAAHETGLGVLDRPLFRGPRLPARRRYGRNRMPGERRNALLRPDKHEAASGRITRRGRRFSYPCGREAREPTKRPRDEPDAARALRDPKCTSLTRRPPRSRETHGRHHTRSISWTLRGV